MPVINMNNFEFDLSEFRIVWVEEIPFLIPNHLSIKAEEYLIASQLTLLMGNISVDNVLKNWMNGFEKDRENHKEDNKFSLLKEILKYTREQNQFLINRLKKIKFEPETTSSFACESVFARLQTTIKSIHFHLKFGYYYESFALIRLLLEQLAYAYTASQVNSGEIKSFLSPTASINHLKKLIPKAGKMYGILSKFSHLDTSTIHKYISVADGRISMIPHSIFFSLEACFYYLKVLEYQNIVFEFCFRDYLKDYLFIEKKQNNSFIFKSDFKFKKKTKELQEQIQIILEKEKKFSN